MKWTPETESGNVLQLARSTREDALGYWEFADVRYASADDLAADLAREQR